MTFEIIKEILRGKSLNRTLQNFSFKGVVLKGEGIDLAAKSNSASYYRFLKVDENAKIKYTDLYPTSPDMLKVDLTQPFPVEENSQDFLLLNNVLEHIYQHEITISECHRTLKEGGELYGVVPFLINVHLDPDDFFRYTKSSLLKKFKEANFKDVEIVPLGYGPFSASLSIMAQVINFKLLSVLMVTVGITLDKLLNKVSTPDKLTWAEKYPLSYFFRCKK